MAQSKPGGLIRGPHRFRVTITGELPAEVPAAHCGGWVYANLSFTAALAAVVRLADVTLLSDGEPAPGGSRLQ